MWQTFNLNHYVRVKLTDEGRKIHKARHLALLEMAGAFGGKGWEYTPPKEDENGWSKWQMHNLMESFGAYCVMGRPVPFETEIEFEIQAT